MAVGFQFGLLLAALSAICNGSFAVITKLPETKNIPPLILNFWMAEGVGLSGILLLALPSRVFSAWGLLGGALFVISTANAVTAVSLIGVSAATGVWCGVAVLCSFAWGVLVVGDQVDNMQQALAALAVILLGIAGIVAAAWAGSSEEDTADEAEEGEACALGDEPEAAAGAREALLDSGVTRRKWNLDARTWRQQLGVGSRALLGLLSAVLAGVFGGLILAPMLAAPPGVRGIQFVPSMAFGALLVAPLSTLALTCTGTITFIEATSSRAAGPGILAGAIWNLGNMCCIAAVTHSDLGMTVAMPIMQSGLFVAGMWGICLFKEIRGAWALAAYWASGAVLVFGVGLLAAAKQGW
ncbi:hypothetical protein ACK3TF_001045 [Chlorella vulgaris]